MEPALVQAGGGSRALVWIQLQTWTQVVQAKAHGMGDMLGWPVMVRRSCLPPSCSQRCSSLLRHGYRRGLLKLSSTSLCSATAVLGQGSKEGLQSAAIHNAPPPVQGVGLERASLHSVTDRRVSPLEAKGCAKAGYGGPCRHMVTCCGCACGRCATAGQQLCAASADTWHTGAVPGVASHVPPHSSRDGATAFFR